MRLVSCRWVVCVCAGMRACVRACVRVRLQVSSGVPPIPPALDPPLNMWPNSNCILILPDTPQFRWGNPYFFSENLYQSVSFIYASMYRENVHAIHITMQFAKKSRHCVKKIDSQQQRTKIGALLHVARQSD